MRRTTQMRPVSDVLASQDRDSAIPWVWIEPRHHWAPLDLRALWNYRELLHFLAWRDVKVRYKQAVLGGLWAIIQPVLMAVVFTVFLSRVAGIRSDGVPYPLFVYSGLIIWQMFSLSLSQASGSIVSSASLITKVYFPRLVIPLSSILVSLVDAAIASTILMAMLVYYHVPITPAIVTLPLFLLLAILAALAISCWSSALNVQYRDVRWIIPFVIQAWLFATPVMYPSSLVPDAWRPLFGLNPMVGAVEGFRWALLGQEPPSLPMLAVSSAATLIVLIGGLYYFRGVEQSFADTI
jgi:lipopolysaccharide transport system permease protein